MDHLTSTKIHLFEEDSADPSNAGLYAGFNKHRQLKMISDGHWNTQGKVLYDDNTYFKTFWEII